jgi:hypothetical protein
LQSYREILNLKKKKKKNKTAAIINYLFTNILGKSDSEWLARLLLSHCLITNIVMSVSSFWYNFFVIS